jgi:predicted PurR-regulated permease PerM
VPGSTAEPAGEGLAPGRLRGLARSLGDRVRARGQAPAVPPPPLPPADHPADPRPVDEEVPRLLRRSAAWAWRLILVAILIWGAFRLAVALRLVVLPVIAAILLTALLQPLAARLRRHGMSDLLATWCTFLLALVVIAGAITLTANRVSADYPTLVSEVRRTATEIQKSLARPPFHLHGARLQQLTNQVVQFISQHKAVIAGTVVTGGRIFLELLAGLVLMLFTSFFMLKDGEKIWAWLISGLADEPRRRARRAGGAAWHALTGYVRGTTAVAAIHAVFIGLALWLIGVPLLVPLVILVFLAAFIPLIGILVVGALAIVITLGTKGWLAAVILLAVFLLENQIEGHLLQPLVVGRAVRLHPLAIIVVLAVGGVIAGIPGAIVAVPAAAVITYAWPFLRGREPAAPPGPDAGTPADR